MKECKNKRRSTTLMVIVLTTAILCSACSFGNENATRPETEAGTVGGHNPATEKETLEQKELTEEAEIEEETSSVSTDDSAIPMTEDKETAEQSTEATDEGRPLSMKDKKIVKPPTVEAGESSLQPEEKQGTKKAEEKELPRLEYKKVEEHDLAYLFENGLPEKDNNFYLIEDSDRRVITEDDIKDFNADKLEIVKNEIYARKGYIPEEEFIQAYFINQQWYQPLTTDISKLALNECENENVEIIEKCLTAEAATTEQKYTSEGYPLYGFDNLCCETVYTGGDFLTGSLTNIFHYYWYRNGKEDKKRLGEVLISELYPQREGHRFIRPVPGYKEENGVFEKTEINTEVYYRFISEDIRGLQSRKDESMIITVLLDSGEYIYIPVYTNDDLYGFYCEDGLCLDDHYDMGEYRVPDWYIFDFSFKVMWGENGRSTYDSRTGVLVNNRYAEDTEAHTTKYRLCREEMDRIFDCVCGQDFEYFKENVIDLPPSLTENAPQNFYISCEWGRYRKGTTLQINCSNLGGDDQTKTEKQASELRDTIAEILTSTDEWKELPG